MIACGHCSAPLKDEIEQCGFCGTMTPLGLAARAKRIDQDAQRQVQVQQQGDADAARAKAIATKEVEQFGRYSVLSSVIGTVLCCVFPVGPALGVYFASKARSLARERGLTSVGAATIGGIAGYAGIALSVAMWVGIGVMTVVENRHKTDLRAQITQGATLDLKSACAITELEMMATQYEKFSAVNHDFMCDGADLEVNGIEAKLWNAHFTREQQRIDVVSCLKLGSGSWSVKQLRGDEDCAAPAPEGSSGEEVEALEVIRR